LKIAFARGGDMRQHLGGDEHPTAAELGRRHRAAVGQRFQVLLAAPEQRRALLRIDDGRESRCSDAGRKGGYQWGYRLSIHPSCSRGFYPIEMYSAANPIE
jgi:hypothetical protein